MCLTSVQSLLNWPLVGTPWRDSRAASSCKIIGMRVFDRSRVPRLFLRFYGGGGGVLRQLRLDSDKCA